MAAPNPHFVAQGTFLKVARSIEEAHAQVRQMKSEMAEARAQCEDTLVQSWRLMAEVDRLLARKH